MKKIINRFESPTEFGFLVMIFIVSLYFFVESFQFTGSSWSFPRFTSLATLICIFAYVAKCLLQRDEKQASSKTSEEKEINRKGKIAISITITFFVAYLILVWLFGFLIPAVLFAILYPLTMGYRKPIPMLASIVINTVFVLVFQKLIGISLTRGVLLDLTALFF